MPPSSTPTSTATACSKGLNLPATLALADAVSIPVIASGGLASLADIERAARSPIAQLEGAITGRALYDGRIDAGRRPVADRRAAERGARSALGKPMRARTVFIVLLIAILLIGFGPALIALGSQMIAEGFGCAVDLNRVIPCVIHGTDYGETFYNLGFAIWYSYLSLPVAGALFVIWLVFAIIGMLAALRQRN